LRKYGAPHEDVVDIREKRFCIPGPPPTFQEVNTMKEIRQGGEFVHTGE
jgi:hypothetical protein